MPPSERGGPLFEARLNDFTEKQNAENVVEDVFSGSGVSPDDLEIEKRGTKFHVNPDGYFDDNKFSTFTGTAKDAEELGWSRQDKDNYIQTSELESRPQPWDLQQDRPSDERRQDRRKDAPVTTDPERWASNKDHYDYPGVDTGPKFREEFGKGLNKTELNRLDSKVDREGPLQPSEFDDTTLSL